jgi:hypothetical protein
VGVVGEAGQLLGCGAAAADHGVEAAAAEDEGVAEGFALLIPVLEAGIA